MAVWSGAAVGIARCEELRVRLTADEAFDASSLWFHGEGAAAIPWMRFPADGDLLVGEVAPGRYTLHVDWPADDRCSWEANLLADAPFVAELELAPRRTCVVELPARERSAPTEVRLSWVDARGVPRTRCTFAGLDGRARFPACAAGAAIAELVVDGRFEGAARVRFAGGNARMQPVARALELSLVDAQGAPLAGGEVVIASAKRSESWSRLGRTDAHGRVRFPALDLDELLVCARHPAAGARTNLLVPLARDRPTALEVALDARPKLALRLLDGDRPLGGVEVGLFAASRAVFLGARHTDGEGLARWSCIEPGTYQVHIARQGLWPTWARIEVRAGDAANELRVPARGSLELRARDATGGAVAGAQAELVWLAGGERVADWVAQQRVAAIPRDLRTGADGRLQLRGLPQGRYELVLTTPHGAQRRERLEVPAGALRTRTLRID